MLLGSDYLSFVLFQYHFNGALSTKLEAQSGNRGVVEDAQVLEEMHFHLSIDRIHVVASVDDDDLQRNRGRQNI